VGLGPEQERQVQGQVLGAEGILVLVALGESRFEGRVASNEEASCLALALQNSQGDLDKNRVGHRVSSHGDTHRRVNQGREEPSGETLAVALDCAAVGEAHGVDGVELDREENESHVEIEVDIHKGERHKGSVGRYRFS